MNEITNIEVSDAGYGVWIEIGGSERLIFEDEILAMQRAINSVPRKAALMKKHPNHVRVALTTSKYDLWSND